MRSSPTPLASTRSPGIAQIPSCFPNWAQHDRRMNSLPVLRCAAMLALALPSVSNATTLAKLSLDDLVSLSDEVVGARCESSRAEWLGKKVYTIATFRVNAAAKGASAAGQSFDVHTLGGRVDKPYPVEMRVEGAPAFDPGGETLLFLERYGAQKQFRRIVGLAQGSLPISTDPKTGVKTVHADPALKSVQLVEPPGRAAAAGAPAAPVAVADGVPLDGFLDHLRGIHARQSAAKSAQGTPAKTEPGK